MELNFLVKDLNCTQGNDALKLQGQCEAVFWEGTRVVYCWVQI